MIKVDENKCKFTGDLGDISSEIVIAIFSYALLLKRYGDISDKMLMDDMLELMKEIQYIVGCVSRGEDLEDKLSDIIEYMFD